MTLHRIVLPSVVLVSAAALALTSVAVGSTGGTKTAATKSLVAIRGLLSPEVNANFIVPGRFIILTQSGVTADSGSAAIRPNNGPGKTVDGQYSSPVLAQATLKSKKGILGISMRGVSITIGNFNPTKPSLGAEYGTWKITSGYGAYAGWKGGGRWASASSPTSTYVEWVGLVTK
jgi:hypothetical protein